MNILILGGVDHIHSHLVRLTYKKENLSRVMIFDNPGRQSYFDGEMAFPLHIAEEMIQTLAPARSEDVKRSNIGRQAARSPSRKAGETKC
jgi:hypothetical protein